MGEHLPAESPREVALYSLITCSKCHRQMDSPRELDCGHIFCQDCLPVVNRPWEKQCLLLRQVSVVCLECGKFTHIPGKDVDRLPQASWVQLLKTFLGSSSASEHPEVDTPCSGCKSTGSEVWCQDCDILLCRSCADSHVLLRKMKGHIIVDKSNALSGSRNMLCSVHGDPMKWLCEDCPRLLCFLCIHQGQCAEHNYENISKLVQQKKTKVQNISAYIENECDKLFEFQKALSLFEEDKTSLFEEYQEKVIDHINQCVERLQHAKAEMLVRIAAKKKEFKESLREVNVGLSDKLKEYDKVKDVIQTILLPSHQIELTLACPLLEKRINVQEPSQYRLREQVDDFNLIFKEGQFEVPELLVKPKSLSPRRSPRQRVINMIPCSLYGTDIHVVQEPPAQKEKATKPTKPTKPTGKRSRKLPPEFSLLVPPPLPERTGLDEVDKTMEDTSPSVAPSTSDSDADSFSLESLSTSLTQTMEEENQPVCNSIVETIQVEKKSINPVLMTAALPPKPQSNNSIFHLHNRTKGYAIVNSTCMHPLPPSDKPITWESIPVQDGFEVISLPTGNVLLSCENGIQMYDPEGKLLMKKTILGAKGMAYRARKRDILVAGYHSNTVFALHDTSLTFKADLKVTMKKSEKPWGCAALSNGGFVILYSKHDKYFFLDFYDEEDKFVKTSECSLSTKGPLRMTTDSKDLIFISDESHDQVVICYPNESYIQTVIVDSPRGMACSLKDRGVLFASNTSVCQLKLSPRDGRFSYDKVAELSVEIKSVTSCNNHLICLTADDLRVIHELL